jgi:hypothetical protein
MEQSIYLQNQNQEKKKHNADPDLNLRSTCMSMEPAGISKLGTKEEADGGAGESASAIERGGRGDAHLRRHRCSRAPATPCRIRRPCLQLRQGPGRHRSASGQLNLDLPGAGPAGQDPPSIARERRPPPSGGARRVLACRESSARSTHGSKQKRLVKVVAGKRPMPVMPMSHACRRPCRDPRTSPRPIVLRHERERETPMGNGETRGVEQRQAGGSAAQASLRPSAISPPPIDREEPRELEIR